MDDLFTIVNSAANTAADHTPQADLAQLRETLHALIASHEPFTSETIWNEHPEIRERINGQALGALFLQASKAGLITKLGIRNSTDRKSHGRDKTLWFGR